MRVKFDKNSKEFQLFGDFYNLVKNYYETEETEEYWQDVMKAMTDFQKKYGVDNLEKKQPTKVRAIAQGMLRIMLEIIDRKWDSDDSGA